MKKILIVSGDSFSDPDFRSGAHPDMDVSWPKWPELLAEKWDMKLINLSQAGSGNEYIYSRLQDIIMKIQNKSKIGMVIASWSQAHRWDYQICMGHKSYWDSNMRWSWENERVQPKGDIIGWMRKSIRNYLALQILCERYDLPYRQLQTGHLFEDWYDGDTLSTGHRDSKKKNRNSVHKCLSIIESYDQVLNTDKFIGWPISEFIGGFSMQNKILGETKKEIHDRKLVISKTDGHPNAKGQKAIADFLIKFII